MSVLIKGTAMPENCEECAYQISGACFANGVNKGVITLRRMDKDRPDWCPLVELPEKHGRLIDADEISFNMTNAVYRRIAEETIAEAPTVFVAERRR